MLRPVQCCHFPRDLNRRIESINMQRGEETRTKKPQSPPCVTIETPNKPTGSENIVETANRIHYTRAVTSVYAQPNEKSRLERYVRLSKWDERVLRCID